MILASNLAHLANCWSQREFATSDCLFELVFCDFGFFVVVLTMHRVSTKCEKLFGVGSNGQRTLLDNVIVNFRLPH